MPATALQTAAAFRAALLALVLAACAAPKPLPGDALAGRAIEKLPQQELVEELDARGAALHALKGRLAIGFQGDAAAGVRSCRAALAARAASGGSPGLYVKGTHQLAATLFTLVSDGERFWLHVPRDNVLYTGPVARRRGPVGRRQVRLDARDLFRSLFVEPLAGDAVDVVEEPSRWVLSATRDGRLRRRLWIERRGLAVAREVFFDAAGAEELAVERGRWQEIDGRLYPARIELREPASGARAVLEFDALTLNPVDLPDEAFRPISPPDARVEAITGLEGGS